MRRAPGETKVGAMNERTLQQPAVDIAYIACDLADDETLADFRKRSGHSRRRWWQVGQR